MGVILSREEIQLRTTQFSSIRDAYNGLDKMVKEVGNIYDAAKRLNTNAERINKVLNFERSVPKTWRISLRMYLDGKIKLEEISAYKNKDRDEAVCMMETKKNIPVQPLNPIRIFSACARYKLVQLVDGQHALLPKGCDLPFGARFVEQVNGSSVYMDGRLKSKYWTIPPLVVFPKLSEVTEGGECVRQQ